MTKQDLLDLADAEPIVLVERKLAEIKCEIDRLTGVADLLAGLNAASLRAIAEQKGEG